MLTLEIFLTYYTFSKRGTFESGQPQISNLDRASWAGDEYVVTLQVTVDDGRCACVQEMKAFEDLSTPALQQFQLHLLEPFQVPKTKTDYIQWLSLNMKDRLHSTTQSKHETTTEAFKCHKVVLDNWEEVSKFPAFCHRTFY